jgi:ribosome biogenesis protein YTM1
VSFKDPTCESFPESWYRYFLTGSYDSTVRIYNDKQELLQTIGGHSAPVSSVCIIPQASNESQQLIASASYDTTARITSVPLGIQDLENPQPYESMSSLHLHTSTISSIACDASGQHLLTGGWDTLIGIWTTEIPESDEVDEPSYGAPDGDRSKKRRKVRRDVNAPVRKAPQSVMKSHTGRISSIAWSPLSSEPTVAYSCGWDFTVRGWDVEAGVCTSTLVI